MKSQLGVQLAYSWRIFSKFCDFKVVKLFLKKRSPALKAILCVYRDWILSDSVDSEVSTERLAYLLVLHMEIDPNPDSLV